MKEVITKLINASGKKIVFHSFSDGGKDTAIINMAGMNIKEDGKPNEFIGFIRQIYNNVLVHFENDYDIFNFRFFATSIFNNKLKNLKIEEYALEIKIMINYLEKEYKKLIVFTNSFSSLCVLLTLNKYNFKSDIKIIMCGPAFYNASSHLKYRIKLEDSKVTNLLEKIRFNRKEKANQLISNYDY